MVLAVRERTKHPHDDAPRESPTALRHEEPDRCPLQISFTPEFASRLRLDLFRNTGTTHNPHGGGNTYELEQALGEDMLLTSVGWANCYYLEAGDYTDEWGIGWKQCEYTTRFGAGHYTEISGHPLADDRALRPTARLIPFVPNSTRTPPAPSRHSKTSTGWWA